MKNEVLCMHSHLIKIKNTHFHITIHSINKNGNYAFHTYILINHHRISFISSCILNTLMHLFLNVNIKQKKSKISKIKNIAHIRTFMHLPHFARFILRPAWCGHDLNLSVLKKNHLRPSLHCEGLHLIEK